MKALIQRIMSKIGHKAEHYLHMTYLGAVGIEGHGNYRYAAIVLLVVVVLNATVDIEE